MRRKHLRLIEGGLKEPVTICSECTLYNPIRPDVHAVINDPWSHWCAGYKMPAVNARSQNSGKACPRYIERKD